MSTLRLLVAYDGSGFSGFATQPGRRTVQGVLESALERLASRPIRVVGAGRTDAGVHAVGQVVSCPRPRALDDESVLRALGGLLPQDLAAVDAAEAPAGFDARHDARWRTYTYLVWNHAAPHPLLGRFATWISRPVDVDLLRRALADVAGSHDFSSFARVREDQSPVRNVFDARADRSGDLVRITVSAGSFLHQMVRSVVGSALEVATGRRPVEWMRETLDACSRAAAGPVAPPAGLTLVAVGYEDVEWLRARDFAWPFDTSPTVAFAG